MVLRAFGGSLQKKFFLSHFLTIVLVSGIIGTYFYFSATDTLMKSLQSRLLNTAAIISQLLDGREMEAIRQESDMGLPVYKEKLALLRSLRRTNPDIAYLYIMRTCGEKACFVIDSDETPAQAHPGREYTQDLPAMHRGFTEASVDSEINTDEWGSFLSGYAPLRNGQGQYLVGLDMRADEVRSKFHHLRISGIISLLASVMLALLFSRFLAQHLVSGIQRLIKHCAEIASGRLGETLHLRNGDELDRLVEAFNRMSTQLAETHGLHQKAREALEQAKGQLELRVEERTRELKAVNGKLLEEIAERKKAEEALAKAARTDVLTGLLNRRAMADYLEFLHLRFRRSQAPFAVMLADVDHFKEINDRYGHQAGDQILWHIAQRFKSNIRELDQVARWGGEEFLIVLPETDLNGALTLAEKLRMKMDQESFNHEQEVIHLTVSIGVAQYRNEMTLDDCIKAADSALYEAKGIGRNRVVAERSA